MATISPINRGLFSSIRFRIALAYLSLLALVLVFVAFSVSSIVQDFLIGQRVSEQEKIADDIAVTIAPNYANANAVAVYDTIVRYGQELGGRILVLDTDGVVQADSFSLLNGVRLRQEEIEAVRTGSRGSAHGLHKLEASDSQSQGAAAGSTYVMYYASSIVYDGNMLGVLVMSVPVQDIVNQVRATSARLTPVFIVTCLVVLIVSFAISKVITRPIEELTGVIEKMSRGEVHQRVKVTGNSELSRLGAAFNAMSEQLERIEQNRNEFVSDVSHELRTPLSSMKILIESMLYDENIDIERHKEFLTDVNKEIDRLTNIIGDLLLLVSMEHVPTLMHTSILHLDELVYGVVKRMEPLAQRKGIELSFHAGSEAVVRASELKLQQALTNLIDNAIKYTQEGGHVDVLVAARQDRAEVCVSDTGIGIPEEDIKHIVERFYRVEKARSRSAGGTGLGLSIVEKIVKMHGGTLDIQSREGEGTTIIFSLPLWTQPELEE